MEGEAAGRGAGNGKKERDIMTAQDRGSGQRAGAGGGYFDMSKLLLESRHLLLNTGRKLK
jgi:hypothetical protein